MKRIPLILSAVVISLFVSCGGAETKADNAPDTYNKEASSGEEKIPESAAAPAPAAKAGEDSITAAIPGNNEILARIDKYLVSTPVFTADGNGINNAVVTVKNTLPNTTFQKAIVEVNTLSNDGKIVRNDFFTIQNIEPGDVETIKVPSSKGTKLVSHVVKVKSNELTNGEMVIVGTLFEGNK